MNGARPILVYADANLLDIGQLLHDLYLSSNIRVMKSRTTTWTGRVACMRGRRGSCKVLVGNMRDRSTSKNQK